MTLPYETTEDPFDDDSFESDPFNGDVVDEQPELEAAMAAHVMTIARELYPYQREHVIERRAQLWADVMSGLSEITPTRVTRNQRLQIPSCCRVATTVRKP